MTTEPASLPPEALAVIAHDAYWHCKEVGEPPPFDSQSAKLQQCWLAAAQAVVTAAERPEPLLWAQERVVSAQEAEHFAASLQDALEGRPPAGG